MKKIVLLVICLTAFNTYSQNLATMSTWVEGPVTNSSVTLGNNENFIQNQTLPNNSNGLVWVAKDGDATASNGTDGGFHTNTINIETDKMYMFTVWVKRKYGNNAATYFGSQRQKTGNDTAIESSLWPVIIHSTNSTNPSQVPGSLTTNPYFFIGKLPTQDEWYLLVGYIRPYNDNSTTMLSSIYSGVTKEKITNLSGITLL
jgi:hypothetical protein